MKLVIFRSFGPELERAWRAVELSSSTYLFQTYSWVKFWHQTIGTEVLDIELSIAVVFDTNNAPKMIAPLGVRRCLGVRVLEFLGGQQSDYLGPLMHDDLARNINLIRSAWGLILSSVPTHDVRHFYKLPEKLHNLDNPFLQILSTSLQGNSYFANLPKNLFEFQKKIPSKVRSDNSRQRRRLSRIGNLSFKVFDVLISEDPALDIMIEQKRIRYRSTGVPDILENATTQKFYREIPKIFTDGRIHFSMLMLDKEILATHWGAVHRNRFYFLIPTLTNGNNKVFSPGKLLLESLIEWSINNQLEKFDFTIGGEEYKKKWCDGEMLIFEHLKIVSPFGIPYIIYVSIKNNLKKNQLTWTFIRKIYSLLKYGKKSRAYS